MHTWTWVGSYLLECGQHFSGYTTEEASKHLPRQPLIENGCLGRGRASWTLLHPWRMLMHPILCRQPQLQWAHECNYYTMFIKHLFVCFCSTFLYPLFFLKLCFWPLFFSVLGVLEGVIEMSCLGLSTPWSLIIDSLTSYESQQ